LISSENVAFCSLNRARNAVHNVDASGRFFAPPLLGHPPYSHSCRLGLSLRGYPEVPVSGCFGTGRFTKIGIPWLQYSAQPSRYTNSSLVQNFGYANPKGLPAEEMRGIRDEVISRV
jgi:hypothetical protein